MRLSDYGKGESKYLRADDLPPGKEVRLPIGNLKEEQIEQDGGSKAKLICYFEGKEKGLVLNATNIKVLVEAYGDDPQDVCGKDVILYRTTVDFKGQMVPALRLRVPTVEVSGEDIPF